MKPQEKETYYSAPYEKYRWQNVSLEGVELLDLMAMHALQGILAGGKGYEGQELGLDSTGDQQWIVDSAYDLAKCMLRARQEVKED
jgi:hypothetical protein